MNKKVLTKFLILVAVVIIVVIAWLFVASLGYKKTKTNNSPKRSTSTPTARDAADWDAPFMRKIEVEIADKEDLDKMGVGVDGMTRIQILERDASGKVTAYKKINRDEDIIQYVYDPRGANATTTTTSTPTSTKEVAK